MATLDDKILGEKLHYYCSSSDEEEEEANERDDEAVENEQFTVKSPTFIPESDLRDWDGSSVNTGPKGVIKDWQRYKQLETEKRDEQEKEKLELMKKLSLTCRSHADDEKAKQADEQLQEELKELLEDKFLEEYMQKRMSEMMAHTSNQPRFGYLVQLKSGQEFLDAVDKEGTAITVIIHIYREDNKGCEAMNGCLQCLAQEYPQVKFCTLEASSAGMSKHFKNSGVPALLVYKGGNLIGNFIRLTDEFGDDFYAGDVESFLLEHGMLPDQSLVPTIIRGSERNNEKEDKDDSDFDVE